VTTLTIKFAASHDAPWFVADGSPEEIKQQLIEFFGLTGAAGHTPHEVALTAVQFAMKSASEVLDLQPSNSWPSRSDRGPRQREPKEPENPYQATLDAIATAKDKRSLTQIWVTLPGAVKSGSEHPEVKQAFNEKGKTLA